MRCRSRVSRALAAALLLFATAAAALDPPYLAAWPTADRVLADHVGENEDDTLARQLAAFNVLRSSIEYMAGDRRWQGLTADELRLRGEYGAAAERIRQRIFATHKDGRAPDSEPSPAMRKWTALQWSYEGDPRFRHETLSRYLPAEAVARIEGESPQSIAPRGRGAKMWPVRMDHLDCGGGGAPAASDSRAAPRRPSIRDTRRARD